MVVYRLKSTHAHTSENIIFRDNTCEMKSSDDESKGTTAILESFIRKPIGTFSRVCLLCGRPYCDVRCPLTQKNTLGNPGLLSPPCAPHSRLSVKKDASVRALKMSNYFSAFPQWFCECSYTVENGCGVV